MSFLNKKIFNSGNRAFGLEISDLTVRVAEIEEDGGKRRVVSFGSCDIAGGSIVDGEIVNEENVITAIREAVRKAGPKKIRSRKVVCALPETKGFLRVIQMPKMKEEELGEAIKWEIEGNIPLAIDQVYYDWRVLEKNLSQEKDKVSILVVAVAQKVVDQLVDLISRAGIELVGLELEAIAQARSLINQEEKEGTDLIIDLGGRRTSFIITEGGVPCFTSSIPLSCGLVADCIAKALNVPLGEAEKIKATYGIGSFIKKDPVFLAVEASLENLIEETERSIDFYISGLKYSDSINNIIVCGRGAEIKGLLPFFAQKLNRTIRMSNPWINFNQNKDLPIINKEIASQYATAIGLAMRGVDPYEEIY
jgi:type IV pilus assembly protein PilM